MRGRAVIMQQVAMAIILSLIWFQVSDDQNGVQDRVGVLFFITTSGMMQNVMGVLTTFSGERGAVLREQDNGMYRTLPYFCARIMCDVPIKIVSPILFGSIAYWSVGFQASAEKFLTFLALLILLYLAGNSLGLFLACVFSDVTVALAIAPLFILPLVMFSGFVINPESIPVYLKWVEWISPAKYAFAALAQNEFGGLVLHCTPDQLRPVPTEEGGMATICNFRTGDDYLRQLNVAEFLTIENCAFFLMGIGVLCTCLAYVGLLWISRGQKVQSGTKAGSQNQSAATPDESGAV